MRKIVASFLILFAFTRLVGQAFAEENTPKNALFAQPISTIIMSSFTDHAVVSIGYERSLNSRGLSLFIPLHAGYYGTSTEDNLSIGSGLGVRKYINQSFSGSYLGVQSDYVFNRNEYQQVDYNLMNSTVTVIHNDYVSISQLDFGYKWMWRSVTLDLSLGGAFYASKNNKSTNIIGAINIGFPFGKENFGL